MKNPLTELSGARRIQVLARGKWLGTVLVLLLAYVTYGLRPGFFLALVCCSLLLVALFAWEQSRRRQFIREARFPALLSRKLREVYPQLTHGDTEVILRGLRQFFMAYQRSQHKFVAMPSKVVDEAWHAFILHTRAYNDWCKSAFGRVLHHTPAEVLGRDPKRNDGLRRVWFWACKEESINPRAPTRLPLLFALDKKFAIAGGYSYVPDCRDIEAQSGSTAYCGTSFGDSGGGDGGSVGDADGFGGSDAAGSDAGGGDGGGDAGGCGGGCGGD